MSEERHCRGFLCERFSLGGIEEDARFRGGKDLRLLGKGPASATGPESLHGREWSGHLCVDSGLWIDRERQFQSESHCFPSIGFWGKTHEPWLSNQAYLWRQTLCQVSEEAS